MVEYNSKLNSTELVRHFIIKRISQVNKFRIKLLADNNAVCNDTLATTHRISVHCHFYI